MDLNGYDAYMAGKLSNYSLPREEMEKSLVTIKNHPKVTAGKTGKW
jgi:tryptophan synthase beta chain